MSLYLKTAFELSQMLENNKVSSLEITQSFLSQIKNTSHLGGFITVDPDGALEQAEKVDIKRGKGEPLSSLAGIPIGIKDNINVAGQLNTCGSKMLSTFRSPYDATVVRNLKKCELVFVGKTNMDEFAIGTSGESSFFGPSKNPWNEKFAPGGSSSGSATAISSHGVPIALGTDTGGSIRIPASFTGLVGLKPSYGAVSRYGAVSTASSFDQVGPMGKTVKDITMLYNAIKGRDPMDATSIECEDVVLEDSSSLKGITIGIPKELFEKNLSIEVGLAVENSIKVLESLGATIKQVSLPSSSHAINSYYIISSAEISSNLARYDGVRYGHRTEKYDNWEELFIKSRSEGFSGNTQKRILTGSFVLSSDNIDSYYYRALSWKKVLTSEINLLFQSCDLILTPTSNSTAMALGSNGQNKDQRDLDTDFSTVIANLTGNPAITVPCGIGKNNLPMGLQLIGRFGDEQTLLQSAFTYENHVGGFANFVNEKGDKQ